MPGPPGHAHAGSGPAHPPLSIPRLTGPVEVDGRVDEAVWMAIEPLPVVGSTPVFGGWSAEIRIPLSTLRFEEEDGRVLMGATVYRRIARRNGPSRCRGPRG